MARPIWKGTITFGLVNVPVVLYSAEKRTDLSFKLLDSRNSARVRYERVNEETGEEVPWDKIVKGYEYDKGNYVLLSNDELENAAPELTRTIDIEQFVDLEAVDPVYFDKPYYLVPGTGGEKGYVLLREAMQSSGRIGIARVVIRTRGHIAALSPRGDALVVDLLRYHSEIRSLEEFEIPTGKLSDFKITKKEIDLAKQLIDGMTSEWEPEQFRDEYREAVMQLIEKRIHSGETEAVGDEKPQPESPQTVNFMDVLKQSVAEKRKSGKQAPAKRPAKRASKQKAS